MPQTLPGWILFAIIIVSGCASISTTVKLIVSEFGQASQHDRDFHSAYIFGALLVISTTLFIWFEPMPI